MGFDGARAMALGFFIGLSGLCGNAAAVSLDPTNPNNTGYQNLQDTYSGVSNETYLGSGCAVINNSSLNAAHGTFQLTVTQQTFNSDRTTTISGTYKIPTMNTNPGVTPPSVDTTVYGSGNFSATGTISAGAVGNAGSFSGTLTSGANSLNLTIASSVYGNNLDISYSGTISGCHVAGASTGGLKAQQAHVAFTAIVSGTGTVTSNPAGLYCDSKGSQAVCEADVIQGQAFSFLEAPGNNAGFQGWSGLCKGSATSAAIDTFSTSSACTATFGASILPTAGWWWASSFPGMGMSLEVNPANNDIFMAIYMYRGNGTSVWYIASGPIVNGTFTGTLSEYGGGQTLTSAWRQASVVSNPTTIALQFFSPTSATLTWSTGAFGTASSHAILARYPINGQSIAAAPAAAPQTGWYWNPSQGGTGTFVEQQGNLIFLATYMYAADGSARWYIAQGIPVASGNTEILSAQLQEYASGVTLNYLLGNQQTQAPSAALYNQLGQITLSVDSATSLRLFLPNGQMTTLQRFGGY